MASSGPATLIDEAVERAMGDSEAEARATVTNGAALAALACEAADRYSFDSPHATPGRDLGEFFNESVINLDYKERLR